MRSLRRIRTVPGSVRRTKAEGIPRRAVGSRPTNGRSDTPAGNGVDQRHDKPVKQGSTLAARYQEVQRLRKQVLEAESQKGPWGA